MENYRILFFIYILIITTESNEVKEKVLGGTLTAVEEFPFQASIQYNRTHICSGTIISQQFIIAAAHCVDDKLAPSYKILAGVTDCSSEGSVHDIESICIHPSYNQSTHDYDVALVKILTPFTFGVGIFSIDVTSKDLELKIGTKGVCSGWITNGYAKKSNRLQYSHAKIVENAECESAYNKNVITDRMICARFVRRGKDVCQVDSGGPLVSNGELIGIVSWGFGCTKATYPDVYTNIAKVRSFIKSVANV